MLAGPKAGEQWGRKWETGQGGEKRGRETRGVESTLAVIGTGGPVKRSNSVDNARSLGRPSRPEAPPSASARACLPPARCRRRRGTWASPLGGWAWPSAA
eukprot:1181312-Prorocentrum_minimum.AAC.3